METVPVTLEQDEARRLYEQYRDHRHYQDAIDREIQRAYRLISQGRVIIRALESIRLAGLNEQGLPKLAIARATAKECWLMSESDGSARFAENEWVRQTHTRSFVDFPAGSFPGIKTRTQNNWRRHAASLPLIPIHLRPRKALDEYHVLWEAEWTPRPPRDPMLLRRIGHADLWLVVAAWDLTDVEMAALSTRVSVA